jgi:hypothetical protein
MTRLLALALLAGLIALTGGHAQDPPTKSAPIKPGVGPPADARRTLYTVRAGDPPALATLLGRHFPEAAISPLPPGSGHGLLISASPGTTGEILKLLEQIDREPRSVVIGVALAGLVAKAEGGKPAELPELTGTAEQILAKLEDLSKAGRVGSLQRFTLTAVEGQPATVTSGGDKPFSFGPPGAGRGGLREVNYRAMGTTVKATGRVGSENAVAVDLSVQDTGPSPVKEEGAAPAFDTLTFSTKVSVPAGRAVVAQMLRKDGQPGRGVTLVIVTARVVEPGPPARN